MPAPSSCPGLPSVVPADEAAPSVVAGGLVESWAVAVAGLAPSGGTGGGSGGGGTALLRRILGFRAIVALKGRI